MALHLIVKHQFKNYQIAQRIEDPSEIAAILSGPNEHSVLKISAPDVFTPPPSTLAPEPAEPNQ